MSAPRIVVVGSVNIDMVVKGRRLPAPGETVIGGQFVMAPGGKGANQAVAAARLGAEVTLVAKVGRDIFGDQAIENYRREEILTDRILRDPTAATGVALILVDEQGENAISVASGANATLTPADVEHAADRIRAADVLMLQLEIPLDTVLCAARLAAEAGVPVMLDPAPAAPLPAELLARVNYLTPNEHEAQLLTDIAVTDESSARCAARKLLAAGPKHVLITLGSRGTLLATADRELLIPAMPVSAVDTTAAGDAFNGGLAWAIGASCRWKRPLRMPRLFARLSTTRIGAQPSLPTLREFQAFLEPHA